MIPLGQRQRTWLPAFALFPLWCTAVQVDAAFLRVFITAEEPQVVEIPIFYNGLQESLPNLSLKRRHYLCYTWSTQTCLLPRKMLSLSSKDCAIQTPLKKMNPNRKHWFLAHKICTNARDSVTVSLQVSVSLAIKFPQCFVMLYII